MANKTAGPNIPLLALAAIAVPLIVLLSGTIMYSVIYAGRIYVGISAGSVGLEGYTPDEARTVLVSRFEQYSRLPLTVRYGQQEWTAMPAEMGMRFDVDGTVGSAMAIGREGGLLDRLRDQADAWRAGEAANRPVFRLDPAQRDSFFGQLAKQVNRQPVNSRLTLAPSEFKAKISASAPGRSLNVDKTAKRIEEAIAVQSSAPIELAVDDLPAAVVEADLEPAKALAEKIMSSGVSLQFQDQSWSIAREDVADLLSLRDQPGGKVSVEIADQPLQRLVTRVAGNVNRPALNARFDYAKGNLKMVRDGVDGRTLDVSATMAAIKAQLPTDNRKVALPVKVTRPAFGPSDGSKLAIAGVIEEAITSYAGSIPERAYNVELAASRLHGVVVGAGEVFSFNDEVGPVNTISGYKLGFGITQEGGNAVTVPSVGGGICQVATTLFHPVFWAGYQVLDRVPHLYWIPKYGAPPKGLQGLDTTIDQIYDKEGNLVYAVDFTFKNNSPNPILIQAKADGNNLTFTILGTKPTWQVKVDPPKIENVVPAIQGTTRQDDPTMPVGRTIVVEEAREGFKSTIVRTVSQDGKVIDKRSFVGEYVPTRNVILVGTKKDPAALTPTPSPTPAGRR